MKIEGDTIIFKSDGNYYFKERDGKKCNTVRRFRMWSEMKAFEGFLRDYDYAHPNKKVKIVLNGSEIYDSFERDITDICPFDGYWVISWRHEE